MCCNPRPNGVQRQGLKEVIGRTPRWDWCFLYFPFCSCDKTLWSKVTCHRNGNLFYLYFQVTVQHRGKPGWKLRQKPWKNSACWLTYGCLLSLLSLHTRTICPVNSSAVEARSPMTFLHCALLLTVLFLFRPVQASRDAGNWVAHSRLVAPPSIKR